MAGFFTLSQSPRRCIRLAPSGLKPLSRIKRGTMEFWCSACKKWLPVSELATPKQCVKCREKRQERYRKNREATLETNRQWRERNPDRKREGNRRWYLEHADEVIARAAQWNKDNAEKHREYDRRWCRNNLEYYRVKWQRRKALKLGATVEKFTKSELCQYWIDSNIDPDRCIYCGGSYEHDDHVIPLARGGTHERANIVPACEHCNCSKGDRLLQEWRPQLLVTTYNKGE